MDKRYKFNLFYVFFFDWLFVRGIDDVCLIWKNRCFINKDI